MFFCILAWPWGEHLGLQLVTARPGPRGELSGAFFFSKLKEEHGKITLHGEVEGVGRHDES